MGKLAKTLLTVGMIGAISGCKLGVMVSSGGDVQSASGTMNCSGPNFCEFEITETPFSESFTARPEEGYEFSNWYDGASFHCRKSTNPVCTVSFADDATGQALVASTDMGYLMPVFKFVGIDTDGDGIKDHIDEDDDNDGVNDDLDNCALEGPNQDGFGCPAKAITEIVIVDGREWAQVDLFTNLSWNDINIACTAGICSGILNGYDMTGWTWASVNEVNTLFNHYIAAPELGPGPDQYVQTGSHWAPAFLADGWHPTRFITAGVGVFGFLSDPFYGDDLAFIANVGDYNSGTSDWIRTNNTATKTLSSSSYGAWFYRSP